MRLRTSVSAGLLVVGFLVGSAATAAGQETAQLTAAPSFFAIQVQDVEAMGKWYQEVLGLQEVNRIDAEDGRYAIRILSGGGLTVELIQQRGTTRPAETTQGLFKAGFYLDDIEAFHRRLTEQGVDVDERIITDLSLGARSFVFRDPEGNRLQVFQRAGDDQLLLAARALAPR